MIDKQSTDELLRQAYIYLRSATEATTVEAATANAAIASAYAAIAQAEAAKQKAGDMAETMPEWNRAD
jgi:hypothetical protein